MAKPSPSEDKATAPALRGAEQISLDQLVSSTSSAVLRILREHEKETGLTFNPRIWCGLWFDLDRFNPRGPLGGPGGPGGGPIAGQ
jgi:hypothetical protein